MQISITYKTPRGGLLVSLPSILRRASFWITKSSVIRQKCLWCHLRMQRTSPVPIFVSFASSSGPNDFATGTTALLSSSSIWKFWVQPWPLNCLCVSSTCRVNVILLVVDRIMEKAFCGQRRVHQLFVGVDREANFTLLLDKWNEGGLVPSPDYELAAIVTLVKLKDPRPVESHTVIPHISRISFLIIGHSWHIASQYTTSIVFPSSSEPSLIGLNGLLVSADHFPFLHKYGRTNNTIRLELGCDFRFGSPSQLDCLVDWHLDREHE